MGKLTISVGKLTIFDGKTHHFFTVKLVGSCHFARWRFQKRTHLAAQVVELLLDAKAATDGRTVSLKLVDLSPYLAYPLVI